MRTEDWETLIWIHTLTNALSLRDSLAKVQVPNTRSQGSEDRRSIQLSYQGLLTSPACFGSLQVTTTTGSWVPGGLQHGAPSIVIPAAAHSTGSGPTRQAGVPLD